jgi:transcriptional regulator with XRE-family HTH domain
MSTIGERIRKIRDLRGLSQENMAELIGVSLPTYADIERGKRDVPFGRLEQIVEKLGVTLNDILNFNDRVNNFFDQCSNTNVNAGNERNTNTNNYSVKEFQHQIEKLQLELKLCQAERTKLELVLENYKLKGTR